MTSHVRRVATVSLGALAALAGICAASAAAWVQDEGRELPPLEEVVAPSPADEMIRLFHSVERNLERIDVRLNDAGAGDVPLGEVESSGLDDLLRLTQEDGRTVVADIDRILELARSAGGSCSKCMKPGGGGKPGDADPQAGADEARRPAPPRSDEATPKDPGEEQGARPTAPERPDSPEASFDRGENAPGRRFEQEAGDPSARPSDADAWGVLPPKVQAIFRNEGTEDVPVQYRDWIDAYYRRLSASRR